MRSRRNRLIYSYQTPEKQNPPEQSRFEKTDIPNLQNVISELGRLEKLIREEIIPYTEAYKQAILNNEKKEEKDAWKQISSESWMGKTSNFPELPEPFLEKLKKIDLTNHMVAPNVAELIRLLKAGPHIARAYNDIGALRSDINNAYIYLKKYLDQLNS